VRGMGAGTFSMVARCSKSGALGVAVATGASGVRRRVPHIEAGVGAIATQGYTEVMYGIRGIDMLRRGLKPDEVLRTLLREDPGREYRQVAIMDIDGRKAAHTGNLTPAWSGHILGRDYVALGNLLRGAEVLEAMVDAFEESRKMPLAERLLRALEAGEDAGGDRRGAVSSALLVAHPHLPTIDLSVDESRNPIEELRRLLDEYKDGHPII